MTIEIGAEAPAFTLPDTDKSGVSLADYEGKPVALVFIPFAFTGGCEGELCAIRDNYSQFTDAGVQVIMIGCDRHPSLAEWRRQQGYEFPMLSDGWPHGAVCSAYGVFNEDMGCAWRATVMIDAEGKVADVHQTGGLGDTRSIDDFQASLAKLGA